jgi:hypothetical protein
MPLPCCRPVAGVYSLAAGMCMCGADAGAGIGVGPGVGAGASAATAVGIMTGGGTGVVMGGCCAAPVTIGGNDRGFGITGGVDDTAPCLEGTAATGGAAAPAAAAAAAAEGPAPPPAPAPAPAAPAAAAALMSGSTIKAESEGRPLV